MYYLSHHPLSEHRVAEVVYVHISPTPSEDGEMGVYFFYLHRPDVGRGAGADKDTMKYFTGEVESK